MYMYRDVLEQKWLRTYGHYDYYDDYYHYYIPLLTPLRSER